MVASLIQANESISLIQYDTVLPGRSARGSRGLFSFAEYPAASYGIFGEGKYGREREKPNERVEKDQA